MEIYKVQLVNGATGARRGQHAETVPEDQVTEARSRLIEIRRTHARYSSDSITARKIG